MEETLKAGDLLRDGRYEIEELLRPAAGKKVYRARDRVLDCQVALDVFSNNSIMPSGLTVSSWEAHVLGRLGDHPNIATILDHWEDNEMAAMVTRYLTGGSLHRLIVSSRERSGEGLPVEDVFRLSIELAYGLAHIHQRRILYLDLQPHNVLFDEWGTIHLVDFDTAVSLDDHDMSHPTHRSVINYTTPELIDGTVADERADLYSLGQRSIKWWPGTHLSALLVRRCWPRAVRAWLPLLSGMVFLMGCGTWYSVFLPPSHSTGRKARLMLQVAWKAFVRLMLRSSASWRAL
jgi:serine/threonine protein kinase